MYKLWATNLFISLQCSIVCWLFNYMYNSDGWSAVLMQRLVAAK